MEIAIAWGICLVLKFFADLWNLAARRFAEIPVGQFRHLFAVSFHRSSAEKFLRHFYKFPKQLGNNILVAIIYFFFVIILPASTSVFAQTVPEAVGWVSDFAGVISPEYKDKLDSLINELEQKTSAEIAVVTVNSIAPLDEKQYARLVFDKWKIGKKEKDNGILVLLVVKERRWRIETGYGMEGILPDSLCGKIGREYMVPYFKDGRYAEGLYYGVSKIAGVIAKTSGIQMNRLASQGFVKSRKEELPFFMYFFVFFFFLIWNLPWPFFIGLPFTLLFSFVLFSMSPVMTVVIIAGYICSMIIRYHYWSQLPSKKRDNFWGPQSYGGTWSNGGSGSGGFGGGGGGFGGGGGGGAGGGF